MLDVALQPRDDAVHVPISFKGKLASMPSESIDPYFNSSLASMRSLAAAVAACETRDAPQYVTYEQSLSRQVQIRPCGAIPEYIPDSP